MVRGGKKARRLVVDGATFMWSLGHSHRALGDGRYEECCENLDIRLFRARGRLRIVFRAGPDRFVADGYLVPSGAVGTEERRLNLHEPGTARALLDEALARGWQPDSPVAHQIDGWTLCGAGAVAVAARRGAASGG